MKHILLPSLILLSFLAVNICTANAQNDIAEGDEAFKYGFYKTAADYYTKAYRNEATPAVAYKIAESYRLANDYQQAIKYYSIVSESPSSAAYPNCDYYLASMYRNSGYADSAIVIYQRYLRAANNEVLERHASQELKACQWVLDSITDSIRYNVKHESKNINSEYSESGAVLVGDSLYRMESVMLSSTHWQAFI